MQLQHVFFSRLMNWVSWPLGQSIDKSIIFCFWRQYQALIRHIYIRHAIQGALCLGNGHCPLWHWQSVQKQCNRFLKDAESSVMPLMPRRPTHEYQSEAAPNSGKSPHNNSNNINIELNKENIIIIINLASKYFFLIFLENQLFRFERTQQFVCSLCQTVQMRFAWTFLIIWKQARWVSMLGLSVCGNGKRRQAGREGVGLLTLTSVIAMSTMLPTTIKASNVFHASTK